MWINGKLCVSLACKDMKDLGEVLTGVLLGCWAFKLFSTSRWLSVGTSCRVMVIGWLTGLSSFMTYLKAQGAYLDRLGGYFRLTGPMRRFVAQAALASYVPEGVQNKLMSDAAVPRRLKELEQSAAEEMQCLLDIGDEVWDLI